jgi:hypothetical protein
VAISFEGLLGPSCGRVGYEPSPVLDSGASGGAGGDASVNPGNGGGPSGGGRDGSASSGGGSPVGSGGQAGLEAGAGGAPGTSDASDRDAGNAGGAAEDAALDGSVDGTRYLRIATPGSFADARAACAAAGLRLVEITSQAEHDHAWTLAEGETSWIGGTDEGTEGEWFWLSGAQFWTQGFPGLPFGGAYANWMPGVEPQNSAPGENCATLFAPHLGRWADEPCTGRSYPAICEGPAQ